MTTGQKNVKGFFDSLLYCVRNSNVGDKWNREDLKELFGEMEKLFLFTDDAEKIHWDVMKNEIEQSCVYTNILAESGKVKVAGNNEHGISEVSSRIKDCLLKIDDEIIGGKFIWVAQSKYCGPDIKGKDTSNEQMLRIKENFERFINEVDIDGRIKKLFCYKENGKKREKWIFNAVDAEKFYEVLNEVENSEKVLDFFIDKFVRKEIYEKYCYEGNWKINFGKMCKLIEVFPFTRKGKQEDFLIYRCYDEITKLLFDLLPIIEFNGKDKKIKDYFQWRREQVEIAKVIGERRLQIMADPYEKRAYELILKNLQRIVELNDYKEGNDYIKELYLVYIDEGYVELEKRIRILNDKGREESWVGRKKNSLEL